MSCRFSICVSVVAVAGLSLAAGGCTEVRGRKRVQEANELYKRGRYREAVAVYEQAETMVPALPTLWLNKGYTCRQLIAPGGKDADSRRAADCALAAFKRLGELAPRDARADQLTIQTWFDIDDFPTLEKTFLERAARAPGDYDIVHGLQEVYLKWGKWPQALEWSKRAAARHRYRSWIPGRDRSRRRSPGFRTTSRWGCCRGRGRQLSAATARARRQRHSQDAGGDDR